MTLEEIKKRAHESLDNSNAGHLSIHERQRMWSALGPSSNGQPFDSMSPAHSARLHLVTACLATSTEIWKEEERRAIEPLLNVEDTPLAALTYIRERIDRMHSEESYSEIVSRFDDLSFYYGELHEEHPRAELIAHAASHAVWVGMWDLPSDYPDDYNEEDDDVFPCDFTIACVHAGGAPWDADVSGRSVGLRARFWRWYIDTLYPECWRIAYE